MIVMSQQEMKIFSDVTCPIKQNYFIIKRNTLTILKLFDEEKRVKDVWRYSLRRKNEKWRLDCYKATCQNEGVCFIDHPPQDAEDAPSLILLLESPHKDEYTKDGLFRPIAPAMGQTGDKIDAYLEGLTNEFLGRSLWKENRINVILCNPVQFQASVFEIHKKPLQNPTIKGIRNKLWKDLFDHGERELFLKRLKSYNPTAIINACTKDLKNSISDVLSTEYRKITYVANRHPCFWHMKTNFSLLSK